MKDKIAVIGGKGFIGKSLCFNLSKKEIEHTIFDKSNHSKSNNYLDIEKPETLEKLSGFTTIINLAAEHRDDVKPISRYKDVNVTGSDNLIKTAEKFDINKIIFLSSVAVYGFSESGLNEDSEINFFNEYGRTKYLAENLFTAWFKKESSSKKLIIIRPTVVFGEGNKGNVHNLINQIQKKRFLMIGNGENKKSIAYVDNLSEFIVQSLSYQNGYHLFNYADKPDLSMNELVLFIKQKLKLKPKIYFRLPKFLGILIGYFFDLISFCSRKNLPINSIRILKFLNSSIINIKNNNTFNPPYSLKDALNKTIQKDFLENKENL